jgi:hypothetical protein
MQGFSRSEDRRRVVPGFVVVTAFALLAGCATRTTVVHEDEIAPEPPRSVDYAEVPGRGPDIVAMLRAAPPPETPEIENGKVFVADERALGAKSYVRIGTARFESGDPDAERDAIDHASNLGVDKVLVYRATATAPAAIAADPPPLSDDTPTRDTAAYYVRFKLPFGASFRELNAKERIVAGAQGGVSIGEVVGATPASDANLLNGDIVLLLDGKPVHDKATFQQLLRSHGGRQVMLTLIRNGETIERGVRLGIAPGSP